ncbi:2-C-methyl-D-erythritol 2,4-cyclodiphosphate synthase [Thermosipho melanesiensis]|uniref:2-C-methyl-D-erythritol 2,4-cyclodiphosphate synthase n=2 Tax=Thermosipho melanesiensis TaxID=46541 RepID=A6LJL2_THEM4|nr:2-C-methyl-D-erythritol 2,4-cyclodiphosphate synthase [Thermosipho melanesiensis]ABR30113.1 2-C-methyl-D-erythritol 2,4-cyclodiphosphate synthase [Thermosipho melanesiensis BI429]APT73310.1 2-C-methyl-D-erythritol 2,4-cyclodiphosphate synthase [Thermosipho melanesiensis]OOC38701.1 2-C-methyl-D-erythritol 2,4-cyclodiphosphate synthase [Thermosipho melanesiensis]OOC40505.1 2-C-methyl-D-erythritol 2,4-cyclodiphosphate synthase [Thermosipho melanesiensis]OOC40770.1 2-C-methyl-D-erythritol 2,4-c
MNFTRINRKNYEICAKFIYEEKKDFFDYLFKKNAFEVIKKALLFSIPPFLMENSIICEENGEVLGVLLYAPKSAFRHRYEKWFKILGLKVLGTGVKLASVIGQILLNFSVDDVYLISLSGKDVAIEYELLYKFIKLHDYSRILTDVTEQLFEKYRNMNFFEEKRVTNRLMRLTKKAKPRYLSGVGWDTHKIIKERKLVLGGVEIDSTFGLKGHSDGDVVIHSIIDSLLGVSLKKDIGVLFPESKVPEGISSVYMLQEVVKAINRKGYFPENIDCVVITDFRLGSFRDEITKSLEKLVKCPVSLKFKTGNGVYPEKNLNAITAICVSNIISI